MKKFALLTLIAASAALLNVGCSASGSIKPTGSTEKPATTVQVAYTTAPAPAK